MPPFISRLQPAPRHGGFAMPGYWVWCGSPIRGDDHRYHLFASRWPRDLAFSPHWCTSSEVVRAASDTPAGPYAFEEVVLPPRDPENWDGQMTHNPTIHKSGDTFLLYYTGSTYHHPRPTATAPYTGSLHDSYVRNHQRIGLATAPSVFGPWTRRDEPVLGPAESGWDRLMTTNPAPCVLPDGSVLLVYKAIGVERDLLRLGVARSEHFDGPYRRLLDHPILEFDATGDHVEDAYVWHDGARFEMLCKDMKGGICGEAGAGIHATSPDGVTWTVSDPPLAYSRRVRWDDGTETVQGHLERPQLLIEDGVPTHLFAATCDGPGGFNRATRSWCVAIPLGSTPGAASPT